MALNRGQIVVTSTSLPDGLSVGRGITPRAWRLGTEEGLVGCNSIHA